MSLSTVKIGDVDNHLGEINVLIPDYSDDNLVSISQAGKPKSRVPVVPIQKKES